MSFRTGGCMDPRTSFLYLVGYALCVLLLIDGINARTAEETERRMEIMRALRERQQQKSTTNLHGEGSGGGGGGGSALSPKQAKALFEAMKKMYPDLAARSAAKPDKKPPPSSESARNRARYSQGPDMNTIRARQRKPGDPTSFEQLMQRIAQKDEIDKRGDDVSSSEEATTATTTSHLRALLDRMQKTLASTSISPGPSIFDHLDDAEGLCVQDMEDGSLINLTKDKASEENDNGSIPPATITPTPPSLSSLDTPTATPTLLTTPSVSPHTTTPPYSPRANSPSYAKKKPSQQQHEDHHHSHTQHEDFVSLTNANLEELAEEGILLALESEEVKEAQQQQVQFAYDDTPTHTKHWVSFDHE